ncbi:MAG: hypothetical protein NVSMB1_12640 [Polyangiales bacterium]
MIAPIALTLGMVALFFALLSWGSLAVFTLIFALIAVAASLYSFYGPGKRATVRAQQAMNEALGAVALDVMRARGPLTARALAEQLGVSEEIADSALARLPGLSEVRVETVIDERAEDGLLRYRVADAEVDAGPAFGEEADQAAFDARLQAAILENEHAKGRAKGPG